jgi:hypothetical protein
MPALIPHRFLVRLAHACPFVAKMPITKGGGFSLGLPDGATLNHAPGLDQRELFATIATGWNEFGLGIRIEVQGKKSKPVVDPTKPKLSDGLTLWLDTRDNRSSHRANRFCHQFFLLPTGGGDDGDEPVFTFAKINRAQQDFTSPNPTDVRMSSQVSKSGYIIEAFLPASTLTGYDPEQFPRLGISTVVTDVELGQQYLSVNGDFPIHDDPSLWEVLELVK